MCRTIMITSHQKQQIVVKQRYNNEEKVSLEKVALLEELIQSTRDRLFVMYRNRKFPADWETRVTQSMLEKLDTCLAPNQHQLGWKEAMIERLMSAAHQLIESCDMVHY